MSDHARGCRMSGSYTVTTCPCCGRKITPTGRPTGGLEYTEGEVARTLRQHCPSGPADPDPEDDDGLPMMFGPFGGYLT